jgi:hypothetical protein
VEESGITIAQDATKGRAKIVKPVQSVEGLNAVLPSPMALMMGMKITGAIDAGGIPATMKRDNREM